MKNKKYNKMKQILFTALLAGVLFSCGGSEDKAAKLEKLKAQQAEINAEIAALEAELAKTGTLSAAPGKTKDVSVLALDAENFKHYIEVQGKVDSDENILISPKMAGTISRIYVKEGDQVRAGQMVAELENGVLRESMEEVKSQLDFATSLYLKQKNLWDQKIGTEVQYLSAKNNKESLEKRLSTLREQMEMSRIKSPINGVVDEMDLNLGQSFMPGMPGIRIVNYKKLKVKADVAETYIASVKKGNDVVVFFPDIKKEIRTKLSFVTQVINNNTRTFTAEAELDADKKDYRPNMIAIIKIIDYENKDAIVVPVNLIQHSEESQFVYIASTKNGKKVAKKVEITTGQIYNGQVEVLSGLSRKDKLINAAYLDLSDGMSIQF